MKLLVRVFSLYLRKREIVKNKNEKKKLLIELFNIYYC